MGCGSSTDNAVRSTTTPRSSREQSAPDTAVEEDKPKAAAKPPAIQPRMNKAAEALAAKRREEKEEEERARTVRPAFGSIMGKPNTPSTNGKPTTPSTTTRKSTSEAPKSPMPKPAAKASPRKSDAAVNSPPAPATLSVPVSSNLKKSDSWSSFDAAAPHSPLLFTDSDFEGFKTLKLLGKGAFGSTYECALRSCKIVCVKIIEFGGISDSSAEMATLRNEIALMKRFHHPNIVQYYGCTEDTKEHTINIFMEYVTGGTLTHYMSKFQKVSYETARDWARQMCLGVKYLHDQGIVHRDIKGANILMTNNGEVKLADFGCSKSIDEACSKTRGCQTMVGTPYWMAPEVLKCEPYGTKSDVWSIGCTIVEMITGKPPWPESDNMWGTVYKIANSKGLPPLVPKDLPKDMMSFLERCFQRDPAKRASCDELLQLSWLNG